MLHGVGGHAADAHAGGASEQNGHDPLQRLPGRVRVHACICTRMHAHPHADARTRAHATWRAMHCSILQHDGLDAPITATSSAGGILLVACGLDDGACGVCLWFQTKGSAPFHILGFKCPSRECGGYNTRQIMHADANYTSLYQVPNLARPCLYFLFAACALPSFVG